MFSVKFSTMPFPENCVLFWPVTQREVVLPYRRSGTRYPIFVDQESWILFLDSWPLNMGPIGRPETSVWNYHYSLRNTPEEHSSHLLRGGSLKSKQIPVIDVTRRSYRWGLDFPHLSIPALWPTQPPVTWVPGLSRE